MSKQYRPTLTNEQRCRMQIEAMEINVGRLRLYERAEALGLVTGLEKPLAEIESRIASLLHGG
jgi:hypothetical protein